jgi:L-amino acid N-acyltransferase YncA
MAYMIRLARGSDASAIASMYAPIVEQTAVSFEVDPPDEAEIARRLADTLPSYPWLVLDADGRIEGYAYASRHRARAAYRWSVDVSVYVADGCRRRGVGRGLYRSLLRILTAQGYVSAYAGISLPNPASVALHEAMGFTPIGVYRSVGYKLGAWRDVGWWQLALRPAEAVPAEPRSLTSLQDDSGWPALLAVGAPDIRAGAS